MSGFVKRFGAQRQSGRLRVAGAVDGVLSLRGRRVSGRLGGGRRPRGAPARTATSDLQAAAARLPGRAGR